MVTPEAIADIENKIEELAWGIYQEYLTRGPIVFRHHGIEVTSMVMDTDPNAKITVPFSTWADILSSVAGQRLDWCYWSVERTFESETTRDSAHLIIIGEY